MTFRQKLITGLAAVAVIALFTGAVMWPEFSAFVLQLVTLS